MGDVLDAHREQARALDARIRAQVDAVKQDASLSDAGRREQFARIEQERSMAVLRLKEDARGAVERRQKEVAQALTKARTDAMEQKRALLGDAAVLHLYTRRLELLEPGQIVRWVQEAAPGYEHTLLLELGRLEMDRRVHAVKGDLDREQVQAVRQLQEMDEPSPLLGALEDEARVLDRADRDIEQLDAAAYRATVADKFNVSAAHVPY